MSLAIVGQPYIDYGPDPVAPPARYLLLEDHYIENDLLLAGTTVTAGLEVPYNWIPTPNVDPLTSGAVSIFYAAGPRDLGLVRQQWSLVNVPRPVTYWVENVPASPSGLVIVGQPYIDYGREPIHKAKELAPNMWSLTGLGVGLAPKFAITNHPVGNIPQ